MQDTGKNHGNESVDDLIPPLADFVRSVRRYMAEGYVDSALWSRIADRLAPLVQDPVMQAFARDWPDTEKTDGTPSNLLLYRDLDYGFVLNGQVLEPNRRTEAHDHGESWVLYGLVEGGEWIEHYCRRSHRPADCPRSPMETFAEYAASPGFVDVLPPGHIHRKTNGVHRTVNLVVRSQMPHAFRRYRYNPKTGERSEYAGPMQRPFPPS